MKLNLFITLPLIILIISSCGQITSSPDVNQYLSTSFINSQGVLLKLDSLRTRYTLDEEIKGYFTVQNVSDTNRIHIVTNHGPLENFGMYNEENELVNYQPIFLTCTYYDFYFEPKDIFNYQLIWNQQGYTFGNSILLKVFSGRYFIHPGHAGINTTGLGLWIEITEQGDPISSFMYYHFDRHDSLIVDYHLRNRISKAVNFHFDQSNPIEANYIDYSTKDVVLSHHLNFSLSKIEIDSKSDLLIYRYQISRNDDLLNELSGSYHLQIKLNFKSRVISSETPILL